MQNRPKNVARNSYSKLALRKRIDDAMTVFFLAGKSVQRLKPAFFDKDSAVGWSCSELSGQPQM